MLCNLLPGVGAKAVQAINGNRQKVTLTVKTVAVQARFAECPVLTRQVDGDFTKAPCQVSVTHRRTPWQKRPTWLEPVVDTEVKEDAGQIAVSLAILQHGPIDLIRSNNPLDCLRSPYPGGCYNPCDSWRCAQTHSGCLIPRHPLLRLFWRAGIGLRVLSPPGRGNAGQTAFLARRGHTGRLILSVGTLLWS